MRTMLKVEMDDMGVANMALQNGKIQRIFQQISNEVKPETSYYYSENGCRTALFVFDMKDASQIPMLAEPFFHELNARVQFYPVMNQDDLSKGLEKWSKKGSSVQGENVSRMS